MKNPFLTYAKENTRKLAEWDKEGQLRDILLHLGRAERSLLRRSALFP